jgi:hypothetical protein
MVVIQSALFLGLINVFGISNFPMKRVSIFIISLLGISASYAWREMIERQRQRLELCRYYMRFIESKLNIPLDFCTYEKKVFHDHSKKGDNSDLQLGNEEFPSVFRKRIRGAVFRIELRIAWFLLGFWAFVFVAVGVLYLKRGTSMNEIIALVKDIVKDIVLPAGLLIATSVLAWVTWQYKEATRKMAVSTERNSEIGLLRFTQVLRDCYKFDPKCKNYRPMLGSIELRFQNDIDGNNTPSEDLRREFKKEARIILEKEAVFTRRGKDATDWSLKNGDRTYTIDKVGDKLIIFLDDKEIKEKSEIFYGTLLDKWLDKTLD